MMHCDHLRNLVLSSLLLSALGAAACTAEVEPTEADEVVEAPASAGASVSMGRDGTLDYTADARGDTIPDFSNVGYHGGGVALPRVRVVRTVSAASGDNRRRLQRVIDEVAALPREARGAILLRKGTYRLSGPLEIHASGIVLRGEGEGAAGTRLLSTSREQITLVAFAGDGSDAASGDADGARVGPGGFGREVRGTRRAITDAYVPVGARSFRVGSTAGLRVGDAILVDRPSTERWIHELRMDRIPARSDGTPSVQWEAGHFDLSFERVITRIDGKRITVDAPLTASLDAQYGGGSIAKYTNRSRIEEVGVEDLRGDSVFDGPTDERHAWDFVSFVNVQNAWAEHVTAVHFGHAALLFGDGSRWITARFDTSRDPVSEVTGGRRYGFDIEGAQMVLVHDCTSSDGRHDFVTGAHVAGPNVFLESDAVNTNSEVGPHHRWATGTLFDTIKVTGRSASLSAYDRGSMGTGHGWSGANQVFWNSEAPAMKCAEPPTAHNWNFGSVTAHRSGNCEWASFGRHIELGSLYRAQLRERLGASALRALDPR